MKKIRIKEVDKDNWYECCKLELTEEQKNYMESNAISIAQCKFEETLKPFAIYSDNKIVGFVMYNTVKEELDSYWIYRIMIDKKHQRKGIGKIASKLVLDRMIKLPECKKIAVGYHQENKGSHNLYLKLGFIDRGDRFGKEMAVVLELNNSKNTL